MKETHVHVLEDGTVLEHTHGEQEHVHTHDGTHPHHHSHAQTKAVLNRLSRAIGHMESIKRMVEEGRDCSEVLIQLSAVKSAINNTGKIILQDHRTLHRGCSGAWRQGCYQGTGKSDRQIYEVR